LANVAKHATAATRVRVSATRSEHEVYVEVCDDGEGGATVARGTGLQGLDDRVAAVGGTFAVSSDQSGTTLRAVIPCA
jgi:signal transduction histidine kinase